MAESILRLKVESQEYDNKLKRAAEGLTRYAEQCRKAGGTLQYVDEGVLEFTRSLGKMDTVATTTRGKLAELTKTYTELSAQYRKMTDEEKQGEYGKALASSLDQLRGRIQSSKQELDDINKSINGGGGLTSSLDVLAGKFGLSLKQLTGWGAALAAAKTALDVAKDAFFASESTVDEWGRVMDSSKSLYEGFLTALNTGDISGYLSRIDDIVKAARTAYDELDRLGTMKRIQAPQISAQQTENERMRMMIQTGRYIAPMDGRRNAVFNGKVMQNGDLLSPGQIRAIERQLQGGMNKAVGLIGNEVKQTSRAINALYDRQAKELGMSKREFMAGTSSMAEFDKRIAGYQQYRSFEREHTTYDSRSGISHRDNVANPYEAFKSWGVFRVDGDRYNELVQLLTQRDQQTSQAYGMQSQAYRVINRAEGITTRKLLGGGGGGSGGGGDTTTPVPVKIEGFDISKAASAATKGVDTMPSVYGMADRDAMRAAMGIGPQQYDAKQDISKQWRVGKDGQLTRAGGNNKEKDNFGEISQNFDQITGSVSSIVSGIEQLGIEIPQGLKDVLGGIQVIAGILTAISSLVTIITAIQGTKAIPVVGTFLAGGGIVPKAAGGYMIPGNSYSGDNIFAGGAWVNSGELVLNRAQQGALAQQLQDTGMGGNIQLQAVVTGEQILLTTNNTLRRKNRGELATFR